MALGKYAGSELELFLATKSAGGIQIRSYRVSVGVKSFNSKAMSDSNNSIGLFT